MSPPAPRPRITLVVNDGPLLNALAFSLEAEGWEAAAFATPAEALGRLPPSQCLVIDHRLPGMDGLTLVAELRQRGVAAPALIIAGKPGAAFRKRAAEAGIEIIDKPLIGDELKRRIHDLLGRDG